MNDKFKITYIFPNYLISLSFIWSFTFFFFNNFPIYSDYDTFWHIMAGKEIWGQKKIILPNTWSFTAPDHYWYNISWLWDIFLYTIKSFFTIKAIYYLNAILYSLIITSITYYLSTFREIKPIAIIFTIFLATLILWDYSTARPYGISFLLLIWFLILIRKYFLTNNIKFLFILPFLMIFWVNTHGGFIIGGFLLFSKFIEIIQKPYRRWDFKFIFISILVGLSIFINPYFYKIFYAFTSTTESPFTKSINEWLPLAFGKQHLIFCIYLFLFILSFNIKNHEISFFDKFNSIIWLLLALIHVRNIPIFVIISAVFFASNIQRLKFLRELDIERLKIHNNLIFYISVVFFILTCLLPFSGSWKEMVDTKIDPKPVVNFISNKYPNINFLNDYSMGGAIIYFSEGKQKVFVDGRAGTAYPEEVLTQYLEAPRDICTNNLAHFTKYNIRGVVTHKDSNLSKLLSPKNEWRKIYEDSNFIAYLR
jgi:hypothetical protein